MKKSQIWSDHILFSRFNIVTTPHEIKVVDVINQFTNCMVIKDNFNFKFASTMRERRPNKKKSFSTN
jgi:hypothetical protein